MLEKEMRTKIENHQQCDPKGIQNASKIHPQIYQKMNTKKITKSKSKRRVGGCGAPPYSYLFRPTLYRGIFQNGPGPRLELARPDL